MVWILLLLLGRIVREENQQQMLLVAPPHQLPTSTLLRRIAHWDGSSQEISQVLTATFEAEDYLDCIKGLEGQGIDTQSYIDSLDQVSSTWSWHEVFFS